MIVGDNMKLRMDRVMIAIFLFVFLVIGCIWFTKTFFVRQEISLNSLEGKSKEEVVEYLEKNHLKGDFSEIYDSKVEKGFVISQEPKEGTKVKKNDVVRVKISLGKIPNEVYREKKVNELGRVPIMMYHGIINVSSNETKYTGGNVDKDGYNRTAEAFRNDLEFYYENGLKNYTLAVGGFVGTTYDNINRAFETVAFFGSIDVDATEVYTTYVAGLVAVLGNNFKVKDSVVALDALTIKGPVQAEEETPTTEAEGDAETEVTGPTYSLTYGEIFATNVTYDNPDGKVTNVISIKQITPSVTSDYITEIPTNYVALTEAMINDFTNYYVDESGNVTQECVMVKYLNSYLA